MCGWEDIVELLASVSQNDSWTSSRCPKLGKWEYRCINKVGDLDLAEQYKSAR